MGPEVLLRIVASAACVLSGVLLLRRGQATATAWLLLACALAIIVARMPEALPAGVFAASLVATALFPACAAAAGLCWPARPLTRIDLAVAAGALAVAGVGSGLIPALVLDPRAAGCNACPGNLLEIAPAPHVADLLAKAAALLTVGWGTTLAVTAVVRWATAPRLVRRHAWPMLLGGAAVGLLAAAQAAHALTLAPGVFDPFVDLAWTAELAVLLVMTVGIWFRLALPRRMRGRVARAILSATPTSTSLVDSLARAVGDPHLCVTYNRLNGGRIDIEGRPVLAPDECAVLRLTRAGSTYAEVWYSARLRGTADLVNAVATSSGLALEYLAAQARLRAEVVDAGAARRRIVVRADAERKRLERDLHDGAQQGLITVSMQLTAAVAATQDRVPAGRLHTAQGEFTAALGDLRELARGLFPVSLAEAGVQAALRELGDHTPVPLLVDGSVNRSCTAETKMAMYQLVLDVVNGQPAGAGAFVRVSLDGGGDEPALVLITTPPADPGGIRRRVLRSEDRLIALGGTLTIAATPTGLTLTGEIPCGS